jgi:hypothetical protein
MQLVKAKYTANVIEESPDVTTFAGLNRQPVIGKGQLRAMENMYSKYEGVLYPRPPRSVHATLTAGYALFAANNKNLCWVDGTNFKYDGTTKGVVTASAKSMADLGGCIVIMPDKKYYNYITDTFGTIGTGSPADGEAPAPGQCPNMDMVCVFNNRVWGIKNRAYYGSKYNDPLTWGQFSVPIQEDDSVYFKVSAKQGNLLGLVPLENDMVFATDSAIYEQYGNKPSNFDPRLVTGSKGTVDGKSMVEIDGIAYMLSGEGVMGYAGSFPRPFSFELNEDYVSSKAGTDGRRYYLCLYNGTAYNLYVYDTYWKVWHREDSLNVIDFAYCGGYMYALASDNKIWKFNSGTEVPAWYVESDRFTQKYLGRKATRDIKTELELETGSTVYIYTSIDGGAYSLKDTITTVGYRYSLTYAIPEDAFYMQIKIAGTGPAKIYSITRNIIVGSDL